MIISSKDTLPQKTFWNTTRGNNWLWRILVFTTLIFLGATNYIDNDTFWHLRAGQWMITNQQIITKDYFTFSRYLADWHYPGWLVQVLFAQINQWFGYFGLDLLCLAISTVIFGVVWRSLPTTRWLRYCLLILFMLAGRPYWNQARPHLFAGLIFAVFLWILESYRQGKKNRLWLTPLLMMLWVNVHGSFILGFLLLGAYFLLFRLPLFPKMAEIPHFLHFWVAWIVPADHSEPLRKPIMFTPRWLILIATNILVCGINPFGFEVLRYPFMTMGLQAVSQSAIGEWQSPNFQLSIWIPYLVSLLVGIVVLATTKKSISLFDLAFFWGFAFYTLFSQRMVEFFGIAGCVYLARIVKGWNGSYPEFAPKIHKLVTHYLPVNVFMLLLIGITTTFSVQQIRNVPQMTQNYVTKEFPVQAVAYLQKHPLSQKAVIYNNYNWGAYLIEELPQYKYFIDGRTDLFGNQIFEDYLAMMRISSGWENKFAQYKFNTVIIGVDEPLHSMLKEKGWQEFYIDQTTVILCQTVP